ncbi:KAT8 regulatory NSL complex subunit 1-like isoform X2 [Ahaetulla prasina]|uniref:KAT8 regulatory NSL complex subunit 1-like isoform X2 n=1 Tax=Ahaetulla prasina TaxID=499056 RepID=UPI002647F1B8|nr:KAT8 regulatory NSL complex subunit 1-like isoform X2 [Ahaetulla prasina]
MAASEAAEATFRRRRASSRSRQAVLWTRARSLCRRLRALQGRQVDRHVRQQLNGLVGRSRTRPGRSGGGAELRRLAAEAQARLRAAQRGCDSDATESASDASSSSSSSSSSSASSSSGSSFGNSSSTSSSSSSSSSSSDSEGPEPGPGLRCSVGVGRRLAQRQWAMERAAIICRWTWLQAQVLDLEYRIRQQTDVYKQLRANKGPVILGSLQQEDGLKPPSCLASPAGVMNSRKTPALPPSSPHLKVPGGISPCIPSYLLQNAEKQNSHLAQSLRNLVCQNPSCTPINGSPEPPKACPSPHQVNGISNCLSACATGGSSAEGPTADRHLKKPTPANHSLPGVASALDNSCVAARIRPICRYKKRRLVRINSIAHLNRKPPKPLSLKCTCEQPNSCILCDFKASLPAVNPEAMSLEERIALLDSGFHPILSFPQGNPLHLHFEALLREDHWRTTKPNFPKLPHAGLKDLTNNVGSSSLSAPGALLKGLASFGFCASRPTPNKLGASFQVPPLCLENPPVPHANHVPPHPATASSSSTLPAKKKKVETSYDINNIVIPMSMAAATRVEKLQYKEILTPSWRTVDPKELVILEEAETELEDTSDETYLAYHQKYEELERVRWDSWTGTSSQRRGNRSSSHKADGRWVPPPGCQDSVPNSLHYPQGANSPTASLSPDPFNVPTSLVLRGRGGNSFSEDSSFNTDEIQNVPPWEPRTFPLSDTEYQALQDPSHKAFGQQWNEALRTNHINTAGLSHLREALPAKRQAPPEDGDRQRQAEPRCFVASTLNNR